MHDELEAWLARQAHELQLDGAGAEEAAPETLREFSRRVLGELQARGRLTGPEPVGCYAEPRSSNN
ncbi:hypothetical protein [Deinococcus sonorensis]|uniref:Uncharacterized protein n=2 Tax=Deinococcus sonorensis TaxID=309891 RepID=A0AAU7UCS6_9DEIO